MSLNKNTHIFAPNGESSLNKTTHLAVGAHADDIEFFAFHGILSCYEKEEKNFSGITMTNGGGSPRSGKYANMSDEEMAKLRLNEQIEAARIGKYHAQIQLGHPSSKVKNLNQSQPTDELIYLLKTCKPEVVYTHSLSDRHETHIATALRVIAAVREAKITIKNFWGCEVWGSLDWLPQRHPLDVSENEDLALKLCAVHKSQIEGGKRYDLATIGRRHANATFYESHQTDKESAITFSMDYLPLIKNPDLGPNIFLKEHLEEFQTESLTRLNNIK